MEQMPTDDIIRYADGLTEVAHSGEFVLFETGASGEWRNYKLVHRTRRGRAKRCWWFGCNGQRLCVNRDLKSLAEREPATYRWLEVTLIDEGKKL